MTNSSNNTPRLRFPGFTSEWEAKNLSECFDERKEQFPEDEEYPLMAFVAGKGVSPKGDKYDRSALVKDAVNKKYKRTEYGDFIYSSNNLEAGSIGFNSYGKACISPVYSIFKSKNIVDFTFIGNLLTQRSFVSQMSKFRQGVVYGQWKIPEKEFLGMKIYIPSLDEQQKIASFLSTLDGLITAQGQKVDALKEKKKGLMQQMFPQQGEATPRLRFPGFTSEWEAKNLSECFDERKEQFPEDEEYPLMAFVAGKGVSPKGNKYDRSALVKDAVNKKYKRTEYGDFIYSSNNLEAGSIGFNSYGKACISPVYSIFKSKNIVDFTFIGNLLTQRSFVSQMSKFRQGVVYGQWKIPEKEFLGMRIYIPSLEEQQKIASCLSNLDTLISSEQSKLEILKDLKKGLMQQLFPQPSK